MRASHDYALNAAKKTSLFERHTDEYTDNFKGLISTFGTERMASDRKKMQMSEHRHAWMPSLFLLLLNASRVSALNLTPCNKYFDVVEGKADNVITCNQLSGLKVVWRVDATVAGECPAPSPGQSQDTCTVKANEAFINPVRMSSDVSTLTINPTILGSDTNAVDSATLTCETRNAGDLPTGSRTCQVDYIYPARVTSCTVELTRWTVTGNCSISKMFSSRGRYTCGWYQQLGSSTPTVVNSVTDIATSPISGEKNQSGTCSLGALSFPSVSGVYKYSVVIYPGGQRHDAVFTGNLGSTVERAVAPTVSCTPSDYVPENTDVTCTCSTSSVGKPTGRLTAVTGTGNNINIPVGNHGNYGVTTLQLPSLRLVRGDHNTKKLRCDVDWAQGVRGNVYTFKVGYAPSQATLQINTSQDNTTVAEGDSVTFECSGSGGRPNTNATTLTSDVTNGPLAKGSASVTHTVDSAGCDHSAHYTCTAGNGMGRDVSVTRTLLVNCKPRSSERDIPSVNYLNKSERVTFDITAYPIPNVTFTFLGSSGELPAQLVSEDKISLIGVCVRGDNLHTARCSITVDSVQSAAAAGVYQVNVSNSLGHQLLNMSILYNEPTKDGQEDGPSAAAIGGGIAAVLLIGVCIVVVVVIMRRKGAAKKRPKKLPDPEPNNGPPGNDGDIDQREQSDTPPQPAFIGQPLTDKPIVADEYAVVDKKEKHKPLAKPEVSSNNPEATYAVVNKENKKKQPGPAKPKTTSKDKPKKGKGSKTPTTAGQDEAHIYGNVGSNPNSVDPKAKGKGKKSKAAAQPEPDNDSTGKQKNQDGLEYTTVVFGAASQQPKKSPSPKDEGVEYSTIAFK